MIWSNGNYSRINDMHESQEFIRKNICVPYNDYYYFAANLIANNIEFSGLYIHDISGIKNINVTIKIKANDVDYITNINEDIIAYKLSSNNNKIVQLLRYVGRFDIAFSTKTYKLVVMERGIIGTTIDTPGRIISAYVHEIENDPIWDDILNQYEIQHRDKMYSYDRNKL